LGQRRASAPAVAVLAAVAGLVLSAAGPAGAAPDGGGPRGCAPSAGALGSVDGDRTADVVVGLPGRHGAAGALDVRASAAGHARLTHARLGIGPPRSGDALGAAVETGDLNADGCADVVVGAPGQDGSGAVHVVLGGPDGLRTGDVLTLDRAGVAGDRFGAALALSRREVGGRTVHDLWVGAPGWDERGAADAGAVAHYVLGGGAPGGGPGVRVDAATLLTESTPGVPGFAEEGDGFGGVLAAAPGGVLVGHPREDVAHVADAGAVTWLAYAPGQERVTAHSRTAGSPGVPGEPRRGAGFGSAVAVGPEGRALVGVPGDRVLGREDAGSVVRFERASGWGPGQASRLTQDTPGVPGDVRPGHRFGTSVLLGRGMRCRGSVDAAVGAPGEAVDGRPGAGTVTVLPFRPDGNMACTAAVLAQGDGLSGRPGRGDGVGTSLALHRRLVRGPAGGADGVTAGVLVGVPGEDVLDVVDAGQVLAHPDPRAARRAPGPRGRAGSRAGPVADLRYGTVLGRPAALP
jgi:hypothetical protein